MPKSLVIYVLLLLGVAFRAGAALPEIELELQDGKLIPDRLEIPARTRVKIILRNTGQSAAEFESLRLRQEKVLGPGVTSFVVINPLKPGEYEFFDEFHLPDAKGVIVVK
ncbi:periplasmic lipoprotein involved in iron transport [Hahella sp. CCB-MM4]|uniref:cupredoxin domain-containing protein n=1 Tax=Hahella sp. (strain CCB-MM4) TaxID=1926491 RepID=UPI000B9AF507|nr:cupredoxin domain-containing protein [Hahella sp. CCB-MM4]OZG75372.1 periplasmic lipoprotein involved in iron transport [Hahella sp. CCB-MM4]